MTKTLKAARASLAGQPENQPRELTSPIIGPVQPEKLEFTLGYNSF